ncbi:peptidase M23 [Coraliomargarita sp. CAG:312]|nr:peptidase M23 [Coraliomargarita sp. CAG:312]
MGMKIFFATACALTLFGACAFANLVWPTESKDFALGKSPEAFLQPTVSGNPMSGAFGDVRNNGTRFHEGIDIKPVRRDRRGEPLDDIYCAMDGEVKMVNKIAGNSGYGRYVAVSHKDFDVEVYTLYAHLSEIDPKISIGSKVSAGTRIGKMGRSASYSIARPQAHLHFEIGLRLSDSFNSWYKTKRYKQKNLFGNYNGLNLVGFDPLAFFYDAKSGKINSGFASYITSMPTAYVVRVYTKSTPDFVKIYPALVDSGGQTCGWDIYFTWYGLPQKFERIKDPRPGAKEGEIEIVKYNPSQLKRKCRRFVVLDSNGNPKITDSLKDMLKRIFP